MNEIPESNKPSNSIGPQSPGDLYDKVELMERVLSHIEDPQHRTAFRKRMFEGESCKAIAEELKVSHGCVRQWISRDLARLRKQFPNIESLWRDFQYPRPGFAGPLT
jgi:DNA-directed RNA polymerase specialized sigma24 family protein